MQNTERKQAKDTTDAVPTFEETVGRNGSVVTEYQFEKNNVCYNTILKEHFKDMDEQQGGTMLIADGIYGGTDNRELAASKNIELVSIDLTGRDVDVVIGSFEFNEDSTKVLSCPAGNSPKSCTYVKQTDICQASFPKDVCEHCPYKNYCHPKTYKKVCKVRVPKKMREYARMQADRHDDQEIQRLCKTPK